MDPDAVWMVSGVSGGTGVLDGGDDRQRERGSFGGEFGASHCNQWGLCCVRSCADVVNRSSCRLA